MKRQYRKHGAAVGDPASLPTRVASLPPEWRFVLACAKTRLTEAEQRQCASLLTQPSIDWPCVVELARNHGIMPILYRNLRQLEVGHVLPKEVLGVLEAAYYGNAARNALLHHELSSVLRALREAGQAVIVLKGAALTATVYQDKALRSMSDVDLLVTEAALPGAAATLERLGYALERTRTKEWSRAYSYHWVYEKREPRAIALHVELHWNLDRLRQPFNLDVAGLWTRAVPAVVAGVDTLILSPEDLLLHLCLHICKHELRGGLRPFCDLFAVIAHYGQGLAWDRVVGHATRWGIKAYVYLPLQLMNNLFGTILPPSVLRALAPQSFAPGLLVAAWDQVLGTSLLFSSTILQQVRHERRFVDKVAALQALFSPTVIAKRYALPPTSKKIYVYVLLRVKDLIARYGTQLWRLQRHDSQLIAQAMGQADLAAWLAPLANEGEAGNGKSS